MFHLFPDPISNLRVPKWPPGVQKIIDRSLAKTQRKAEAAARRALPRAPDITIVDAEAEVEEESVAEEDDDDGQPSVTFATHRPLPTTNASQVSQQRIPHASIVALPSLEAEALQPSVLAASIVDELSVLQCNPPVARLVVIDVPAFLSGSGLEAPWKADKLIATLIWLVSVIEEYAAISSTPDVYTFVVMCSMM